MDGDRIQTAITRLETLLNDESFMARTPVADYKELVAILDQLVYGMSD